MNERDNLEQDFDKGVYDKTVYRVFLMPQKTRGRYVAGPWQVRGKLFITCILMK